MKTYYKECLKNHVATIGGTVTDGCGEFMPNGEEGTIEALKGHTCFYGGCFVVLHILSTTTAMHTRSFLSYILYAKSI
ncbi:hypothetical protein FF2_019592 [Malus domestica]